MRMLDEGARLGPFEILAALDAAGTGELYRALDHDHAREVAIRVLRADFTADPERRARFERDMYRAAALAHPHILTVHDVGIAAHAAYIVSEPLDGETLRARLDRGELTPRAAAACALHTARALIAASAKGVRHGDLTPESVFLTADGRAIVVGFGLATLTRPEGGRSDLIALGGVLWEALGAVSAGVVARPRRRVAWAAALATAAIALMVVLPSMRDARSGTATPRAPGAAETTKISTESPRTGAPTSRAGDAAGDALSPSAVGAGDLPADEAAASPRVAAQPVAPVAGAAILEPAPRQRQEILPERNAPDPAVADGAGGGSPATPAAPVAAQPPSPSLPARPSSPSVPPVARDTRDAASLITEATVRLSEFDLGGAVDLLSTAADSGDAGARVAVLYVGGLHKARAAFRQGGTADALAPVREAIASLAAIARGRPGSAEIARLMLHAAAAAAQGERDEMRLYLESAVQMESLQHAADQPGVPLVSAAEVAGDLWLQVYQFEEARQAYVAAAERIGSTLRILAGRARSARGLKDTAEACTASRALLDAWGARPGFPVEIAEARAYIGGCGPSRP